MVQEEVNGTAVCGFVEPPKSQSEWIFEKHGNIRDPSADDHHPRDPAIPSTPGSQVGTSGRLSFIDRNIFCVVMSAKSDSGRSLCSWSRPLARKKSAIYQCHSPQTFRVKDTLRMDFRKTWVQLVIHRQDSSLSSRDQTCHHEVWIHLSHVRMQMVESARGVTPPQTRPLSSVSEKEQKAGAHTNGCDPSLSRAFRLQQERKAMGNYLLRVKHMRALTLRFVQHVQNEHNVKSLLSSPS